MAARVGTALLLCVTGLTAHGLAETTRVKADGCLPHLWRDINIDRCRHCYILCRGTAELPACREKCPEDYSDPASPKNPTPPLTPPPTLTPPPPPTLTLTLANKAPDMSLTSGSSGNMWTGLAVALGVCLVGLVGVFLWVRHRRRTQHSTTTSEDHTEATNSEDDGGHTETTNSEDEVDEKKHPELIRLTVLSEIEDVPAEHEKMSGSAVSTLLSPQQHQAERPSSAAEKAAHSQPPPGDVSGDVRGVPPDPVRSRPGDPEGAGERSDDVTAQIGSPNRDVETRQNRLKHLITAEHQGREAFEVSGESTDLIANYYNRIRTKAPETVASVGSTAGTPSVGRTAGTPSVSRTAGTPSASRTTGTPSASRTAGTPSVSRTAETPSVGRTEGTPFVSRTAGTPSVSRTAGTPFVSRTAGTPSVSRTAGTPSVGRTAGTPFVSRTAGTPSVDSTAGTPSVGRKAGTPSVSRTAGTPSVSRTAGTPSIGRTARTPSVGRTAGTPSVSRTAGTPSVGRTVEKPSRLAHPLRQVASGTSSARRDTKIKTRAQRRDVATTDETSPMLARPTCRQQHNAASNHGGRCSREIPTSCRRSSQNGRDIPNAPTMHAQVTMVNEGQLPRRSTERSTVNEPEPSSHHSHSNSQTIAQTTFPAAPVHGPPQSLPSTRLDVSSYAGSNG